MCGTYLVTVLMMSASGWFRPASAAELHPRLITGLPGGGKVFCVAFDPRSRCSGRSAAQDDTPNTFQLPASGFSRHHDDHVHRHLPARRNAGCQVYVVVLHENPPREQYSIFEYWETGRHGAFLVSWFDYWHISNQETLNARCLSTSLQDSRDTWWCARHEYEPEIENIRANSCA